MDLYSFCPLHIYTLSAPFWGLYQKLSISLFYFNKTLLHKSYEQSILGSDPRLNSSPEAKNPSIFCGPATTFQLGGPSGILQDKVKMLGALVLCSPSELIFCYTLLTLRCACVNEWHALSKASEELCSAVWWWPHVAYRTSLVAQKVKRPPEMWKTWIWSLGWEDLLEKEMATHSSTLAWKIPWTEEPGRLQSMGSQRVRHNWVTSLFTLMDQ